MIVSELIEWLKTQDQEAIVCVTIGVPSRGWEGDSYTEVQFDPIEHSEYRDFRGNSFVDSKAPYFNKRFLSLGVS